MAGRVAVLAGGVGAARFLEGLTRIVDPEEVTVIGNTGDDLEQHGLAISPDLDTVAYTLAGLADPDRGWGLAGDTFACLESLQRFTDETWFQLGDRDLATHLHRTALLRGGATLSEATVRITRALGVRTRILPMSNSRVRTHLDTDAGTLDFQTYFVRNRAENEIRSVHFAGAEQSSPAPGVLEAIAAARAVIVAPSNPIISIGPILAVPGIREALQGTAAAVVAVSPIIKGCALKGPAAKMMRELGMEPSARGVTSLYRDFLDVFVLDEQDREQASGIEAMGIRAIAADTVMKGLAEKVALARAALEAAGL